MDAGQAMPFLWDLAVQGGIFMIPIALCSVVVLAFAIERRVSLQKGRIIPRKLLLALQKLNQQNNGIDPRQAYDECQKYRSPLSRVIQAAILKVGRPHSELEKAVEDAVSREADEMGADLASRLPSLTAGLAAAGAGAARPMSAQELCETIRTAYDPAAAVLIDEARAAGDIPQLAWSDVGPAAAEARWDSYRHDGAVSTSWTMTSPPRGVVQSGILGRLLAPHRDVARKRVTLLYRPIDPARAAALVETDLNAAQFNSTASRKPTARSGMSTRAAQATAQEEAAGAGLLNFGLVVTATTTDPAREAEARAAIDSLSAAARLRMRPAYGSQDTAFAAALPLGLVLPRHIRMPSEVRESL